MELVVIIGLPIFILYTVAVFAIGHYRGYCAGINDAKMIFFLESEDIDSGSEGSEE